jgi:peptidoglycan hydrolase CwlO-like protein
MKNELQTYENNLGFLTASSKKGNSLLTELNRKVEKLKGDIELVKQKIKVIDNSINEAE